MRTKEKGKLLENHVADRLVSTGLDVRARRDGASGAGNREKGDISTSVAINGRNLGIECKNHKNLAIPNWWKQTKKLEVLGREPILAFKLPHDGLEGTLVVIYLETLLELLLGQNLKPLESITEKPEIKWKAKRAKDAINDLMKVLGE
jgi:hypothetical protein